MKTSDAFKMVHGLTMHFRSAEYSVLKYGVNTAAAKNAFSKLSPGQLHKYEWLSDVLPKTQDLVYATIGCIFDGKDIRYEQNAEILSSFYELKKRREGIEHFLKSDITKNELWGELDFNKTVAKYLGRHFTPEYVIIRFHDGDELREAYENPAYAYCKDSLLRLIKYRDFIPVAKYQHIFKL